MSYIWGANSPTSGNTGDHPVDLHIRGRQGPTGPDVGRPWFVPDLYRRMIDTVVAAAVAAAILPFVAWVYRDERKAGQR